MTPSIDGSKGLRIAVIGVIDRRNPRLDEFVKGWRDLGADVKFVRIPAKRHAIVQLSAAVRGIRRLRWAQAIYAAPLHMRLGPAYWLLAKLVRRPLLLDYIVGLSDWIEDRSARSARHKQIARWIDIFNLTRCDAISDTEQHRAQLETLLGRPFPRLTVIPISARSGIVPLPPPPTDALKHVLFVGSFIPFHGIEVIVRAAHLLRDRPDIRFVLIGSGQTLPQIEQLIRELDLSNVELRKGFFPLDTLRGDFERASVCLGVFGTGEKRNVVVPNKILDAILLGRPVITAASAAVEAVLTPGEHLVTIPPGDPRALAEAVSALLAEPARSRALVDAGRKWVAAERDAKTIAQRVLNQLQQMASGRMS
ncbi:MAG: glycosyltransferase [Chloroflexi bacterium]|nr:glycosyltransferase [Chloroflexota bacterium]